MFTLKRTYSKDFKIKACELVIDDGIKHAVVAEKLGISVVMLYRWVKEYETLSNKFYRDRFSAADLIKVAEYCSTALCFLSNDGNKVVIDTNDLKVDREGKQ